MARRRHYRGLVKFPGLGFLPKMPSAVKPVDVALGAAIGLAGGVAITKGVNALAQSGTAVPSFLTSAGPITGGVVSAAALYLIEKKKNPGRAYGHALGAVLGGVAVYAYSMLQSQGMLNGLVRFPGMGAPIFANPRMAGFRGPIFSNPNSNLNLGRLAALQGVGDENEDGMFPAP